ncbi:ParA family protein [Orenia marismortui]|uniref:Sporulation initiation inhibitor protein Soj n=1 Tax=Orenia marismortui TaxID=46469 RepID=A0A4R8GGD8_9FIRM|nr:ParA family protein [Orenia marismortui]TDX44582.1 chromosome segregation ATPase [Orenia marismortui]
METTTKVISIINQKGGVGKTTTALNLAYSLTEFDKRVLIIDLDSQANLTDTVGFEDEETKVITSYELLTEKVGFIEAIQESKLVNLDLIASKVDLADVEIEIADIIGRETILRDSIGKVRDQLEYDYIIIDCPPSLSLVTINALSASDSIIIPAEPSVYSISGFSKLLDIFNVIQEKINDKLAIEGVLITRVDARTKIAKSFEDKLRELFGDKIFETVIHQNVRVAESQEEQLPVYLHDRQARASQEYIDLAKELLSNELR